MASPDDSDHRHPSFPRSLGADPARSTASERLPGEVGDFPLVSVVIPAHNESDDVAEAIASVAAQSYPTSRLEVIVVDGASTDDTRTVARRELEKTSWHRCITLHNPEASTPTNLNIGLTEATGEYLCRVDARSIIPPNYVADCVSILRARPEVAVVGGSQRSIARNQRAVASGIARALNNPVSMGGARYRRSKKAGATDTVYLGFFRSDEVRAVGGWDPNQRTNQDYELNRRLGADHTIWFEPSLEVGYSPRSTLPKLVSQYRRFGRWKTAGWLEGDQRPAKRQLALLAAPPLVIAGLGAIARRSPAVAAATAVVGLAAVERCSEGRAKATHRLVSATATVLVSGAWWVGAVEQAVRHAAGGRLMSGKDRSGQPN